MPAGWGGHAVAGDTALYVLSKGAGYQAWRLTCTVICGPSSQRSSGSAEHGQLAMDLCWAGLSQAQACYCGVTTAGGQQ
jgi:hypothetical protein